MLMNTLHNNTFYYKSTFIAKTKIIQMTKKLIKIKSAC